MATAEHVEAVRAFNRFYTARMGLTRGGYDRPLAELRVLYELGQGTEEVATLRSALAIDGGQLSRLLKRLEQQGLVSKHASPLDARRQQVRLTDAGKERFRTLDEQSANEIGSILDGLGDPAGVIAAMTNLERAIEPAGTLTLRGLEPGDLGWLVQRHGVLYAREFQWDQSFERLVAQIAADYRPETDRAWVAEIGGERVGAVLCVHQDETTAKLRTLLVEPSARGHGVGTHLVDAVIRHAQQHGYSTLTLWTNDVLTGARRIYERAGFTLAYESTHRAFGHELTEQSWSLTLKP